MDRINDDADDYMVDLTEDDIKALEAPYNDDLEVAPKPEAKTADKAADKTVVKPEAKPGVKSEAKIESNPEALLKRIRDAEERAATERQKRLDAERRSQTQTKDLATLEARAAEGEYHVVSSALSQLEAEMKGLKAARRAALEAGDYEAESEATDRLTQAAAKHAQLSDGRTALDDRVKQAREKAKTVSETRADAGDADPFEQFLGQFGPKEQAWFRMHPEFAPTTDPGGYHRALAAHYDAVKQGIKESSEEYFAHLDRSLGLAPADDVDAADPVDDVVVETRQPKPAPTKRVAAPVSRDSTSSVATRQADGRLSVRLTREQREMAESMGMTPTAYAKRLIEAERAGLLSKR